MNARFTADGERGIFVLRRRSMLSRRRRGAGEPQYELGRAAVYSRISNPGDTREASLETQEAAVIERLRAAGYTVTEADIFRDRFTGKETIRRPALNRLRERIADGTYKAVGVYKLDRLSRNMGHTFILLSQMDELGVRPLSVMEPDIDNSPQGKVYRMLGGYMAEAELANIEDRFGRGRDHIAAQGKPLARGVKAYGLVFDKPSRTFSADEDDGDHDGTAKWARLIFEMAGAGNSAHAIADHLNSLGVLPPGLARGMTYKKRPHLGRWSARVVATMIRNPIYKGWMIENKFYSEGVTDAGHSKMRRLPEEDWVIHDKEGKIAPRLVNEEQWAAANRTLDQNANNVNSQGKRAHDYLLRGMIFCSECGAKRYGYMNRHGNVHYRCSNHTLVVQKRRPEAKRCTTHHVRGCWIEPLVWDQLKGYILEPGKLEAAVMRLLADQPRDRSEGDLVMARANLAEQERIRDKFFAKWREEEARPDPDPDLAAKWEADYRAMRDPIESLKRTVDMLEKRVAALVSPEVVAHQAAEKFAALRERLLSGDAVTDEEKRKALLLARTKISVKGDKHRKPGLARGSGEIHFHLFDEGCVPSSSPA
jgi:site-specific DNA recombinase